MIEVTDTPNSQFQITGMIEGKFDFGFMVNLMRKDLRICLDEATRNGADLSVIKTVKGYYDEVSAMGGGRWDTSSLLKRLRKT